ncbi:MAG: hypothetical protein JXR96_11990 [Deltaproteobacteria bacterium]|nr:hypothetical protein [Deltaproteobacteria bacterium]
MARYQNDIQVSKKVDEAVSEVEQYLVSEGFKKNEQTGVWKKGLGLMLGPQFLQVEPRQDGVHLEAWIKFALLPGVYLGEMGIDGAFAVIPKRKLKKRVQAIEEMLK